MKRILSILLLFAFFFQSTSQLWITGVFYANREYIARVLCINRDKPKMGCNGACQLKKRLEKDREDRHKSSPEKQLKEIVVYFQHIGYPTYTRSNVKWTDKKYPPSFSVSLTEGYINAVFHPPTTII